MTAFAISAYPVSGAFRDRLEHEAGERVELVVVPELRRLPVSALVRRLAQLHGTALVALEDPASETLLPILELLAALTRAREIRVVRGDRGTEASSRARAAAHALGLAAASLQGQVDVRAARRETAALLPAKRGAPVVAADRALYLNANLWFGLTTGGSVAHVAGVVNALARRGVEMELATAPAPVGVDDSVVVRRLAPPRFFGLPVESNLYRFGRTVPRQLHDVRRPSFVYQRHSVGSYAGAVLARRWDVPLVLEYNGSEVWVARHWGRPLRYEQLARAAEEVSLQHAHLVVTISRTLADEVVARGVPAERVVWHPNGVDPAAFAPDRFSEAEKRALRERYGIPVDATVVTFVGTFGQWHGVDVLARTIRENAAWARAHDVRFLLVGDGLKMAQVRRELTGAEDVAVLTGLVPQLDAPLHLAASDILVSPHVPNADGSPFFGSPTKLFEYMAAGKPIVASDLDQIGDVLRDDLAILVRPGDPDDLARGIREAVADPARRAMLGQRARQRVLDRYTWEHHVEAILGRL